MPRTKRTKRRVRYDALLFLAGEEPVFVGGHAAVTSGAAHLVTELNGRLAERRCGGPDERRDFILQCVWSMFAEDLGQIPGHRFTLIDRGRSGALVACARRRPHPIPDECPCACRRRAVSAPGSRGR